MRPQASRCTMKSQSAYPASSTRLSRIVRSEVAVGGHATSAASAASSCRPSRPSADALSSAISYSRVAHPERSEFNAIGMRRKMACGYPLSIFRHGIVQVETFPTVIAICCHTFRSCSDVRRRRSAHRVATRQDDECPAAYGGPLPGRPPLGPRRADGSRCLITDPHSRGGQPAVRGGTRSWEIAGAIGTSASPCVRQPLRKRQAATVGPAKRCVFPDFVAPQRRQGRAPRVEARRGHRFGQNGATLAAAGRRRG